jgi:hypothetical protein
MRHLLLIATMVAGALVATATLASVLEQRWMSRVTYDDTAWEAPPALSGFWQATKPSR